MTPETITIPASITIPKDRFDLFAERLGYFDEIEDPNDNTAMIPNPESKIQFVQRIFKDSLAMPWLLQFTYSEIDVTVNKEREAERAAKKKAAYDELSPAVSIG